MDNIIKAINNNDIKLLKESINSFNVNNKIFNIFDDDPIPLWTPLIKISTLKKQREDNYRYNGIIPTMNEKDDCELVNILIDSGVNLNEQDRNGNTALHYCIYYKNYDLMELLVNNGADLNIQDNNGNIPLNLIHENNIYSEFLLKNGSDRSIKNYNGEVYLY